MPQENLHNEFSLYFNIFSLKVPEPIIKAQITKDKIVTLSSSSVNVFDIVLNETIHDTTINHM
jgi:hypothetical protein